MKSILESPVSFDIILALNVERNTNRLIRTVELSSRITQLSKWFLHTRVLLNYLNLPFNNAEVSSTFLQNYNILTIYEKGLSIAS